MAVKQLVAHLDMDAFFASVELLRRPELIKRPLVIGGRPDSRGVVSTCSYEARAFGIRSAMPLSQAQRLCPQATFLPGDYAHYREVSKQVMDVIKSMIPIVQIVSIDEAYLDLTSLVKEEKEGMILAKKLRKEIFRQLKLPCTLGVGPSKLIAKIASKDAKPRGILQVLSGYEKAFLAPKPIEAIPGLGKASKASLNRQGIYFIKELQKLPLLYFLQKYGSRGYWLYFSSQGVDNRKVKPTPSPAKSIGSETTFSEDISDRDTLLEALDKLLEKSHERLIKKHAFTRGVAIKMRDQAFQTITRSHALANATQDFALLKKSAHALFEEHYRDNQLRLIGVTFERLSYGQWQPTFWEEQA